MNVLVACEHSGIVRDAFTKKGHYALSCDFIPAETTGPHYEGDVLDVIKGNWDLLIAHPPSTRIANAGVSWLKRRNLWDDLKRTTDFFNKLLYADIPHIAVEGPTPHKYAVEQIGRTYTQLVKPTMFGHNSNKPVCLWLKNLPNLKPTAIGYKPPNRRGFLCTPQKTKEYKAMFFTGIAEAMADQWGTFIEEDK